MMWEMFSWHTLSPLVLTEHHFNATAYMIIVVEHVHPFVYHFHVDSSSRITCYFTKLRPSQTGFLNMAVHCNQMAFTVTGLQSSRASLGSVQLSSTVSFPIYQLTKQAEHRLVK